MLKGSKLINDLLLTIILPIN